MVRSGLRVGLSEDSDGDPGLLQALKWGEKILSPLSIEYAGLSIKLSLCIYFISLLPKLRSSDMTWELIRNAESQAHPGGNDLEPASQSDAP